MFIFKFDWSIRNEHIPRVPRDVSIHVYILSCSNQDKHFYVFKQRDFNSGNWLSPGRVNQANRRSAVAGVIVTFPLRTGSLEWALSSVFLGGMILCWERGRIVLYVTVCFPSIYLDAYCTLSPSSSNQMFLQKSLNIPWVRRKEGREGRRVSHWEPLSCKDKRRSRWL